MLCLGDSLTRHPELMKQADEYPARVERMANRKDSGLSKSWHVANAGKFGDCGKHGHRRFRQMMQANKEQPPHILMIELGANDYILEKEPAYLEDALQAIIDDAKKWNERMRIMVAGMAFTHDIVKQSKIHRQQLREQFHTTFDRPVPEVRGKKADAFSGVYSNITQSNKGVVLMPHFLSGVAGNPDLTFDLLHPNGKGHAILAARTYDNFLTIAMGLEMAPSLGKTFQNETVRPRQETPAPDRLAHQKRAGK